LVPLAKLGPATATAADGAAILRRLGQNKSRLQLAAVALLVATAALAWSMLAPSHGGASVAVASPAMDTNGPAGGGGAIDAASGGPDSRNTRSVRVALPTGADGAVSVRVSLP